MTDGTTSTTSSSRQRLIDSAADLFYQHGTGAVGVDLISKAAGVSKRTLYAEFGSKDQLMAQTLDANGDAIVARYLPGVPGLSAAGSSPGRDQILQVFRQLSEWAVTTGFRGCPFMNIATELADPGHPARLVAGRYKRQIHQFFAEQSRLAGADTPQRLADQLLALFDGAIVQAVFGTPLDSDTLGAAAAALLDARGAR